MTNDSEHARGSMNLAFAALQKSLAYLGEGKFTCFAEYADERPQTHYRCEFRSTLLPSSAHEYTVHITSKGNPINYVSIGWDNIEGRHDSLFIVNREGRDWSSTLTRGTDVPDDFCEVYDCIDNFEEGNGYVAMCADGTWTQSGGIQGACSHHGGLAHPDSVPDVGGDYDPNDDGSAVNWCGASRDGDGDGLWCEGR